MVRQEIAHRILSVQFRVKLYGTSLAETVVSPAHTILTKVRQSVLATYSKV